MKTIALKTNIMCGSCIAKVTPSLNLAVGKANWQVDIQNLNKILTVSNEGMSEADIIKAVEKSGFKAEKIG